MYKRIICAAFAFVFLTAAFTGCDSSSTGRPPAPQGYTSYRDIPGVTNADIRAIEKLAEQYDSFVFGMLPSTEMFKDHITGELNGYSVLFCRWLTELFGIKFKPAHYEWSDLLAGLESGEVDFSGELTATEERRNPTDSNKKPYYMTDAIAMRTIKYFRLQGSQPLDEIAGSRPVRYIFLEGSTTIKDVTSTLRNEYIITTVDDYSSAYKKLKSGEGDLFFAESNVESAFDEYGDIVASDFLPPIYSPVSLTTQNTELATVISVVQKALQSEAIHYLTDLYKASYKEYLKHKLFMKFNNEEREYIVNNPAVPFAAEYENYPISFYNKREKAWQGIVFDALHEIEQLTGLSFELFNSPTAEWPEILAMLDAGTISFVSELIRTPDREDRYLWPSTVLLSDNYALISKMEYPKTEVNEILHVKVGIPRNTAYAEIFAEWFPNHNKVVLYEGSDIAFNALARGEVDMIMSNMFKLLAMTNYREEPGYKANIVFNRYVESTLGFNKNESVLCSIIDKALTMIDTKGISDPWTRKTYDYRIKLAQARQPLIIGGTVFVMMLLSLGAFALLSRNKGKRLEALVKSRTVELELETATLKSLFDSLPEFVFCKDLNLRYTRCNKKMEDHFGVREADLIGKDDAEGLGAPEEMVRLCNASDQALLRDGKLIVSEETVPSADGTMLLCETVKVPIFKNNAVVGLLGVSRDITERKKAEDVNRLREKMKSILNEMSIVFLAQDGKIFNEKMTAGVKLIADMMDLDAVSVWRNSMTADKLYTSQIYRWDREAGGTVSPRPELQNVFLDQLTPHWQKILVGEKVLNGSVRLMEDPPAMFKHFGVASALLIPLFFNGEYWGFVLFEDLHNERYFDEVEVMRSAAFLCANTVMRSEMDSKLKKALKDATAASRAKGEFLANMSHEIRTPLNAIIGMTAIGKAAPDSERKNYSFNKIEDASSHLLGVINDILDMSKIEAGKFDLSEEEFNFEKMLQRVVNVVSHKIADKRQKFRIYVDRDIPECLIGDDQRLAQVITNLVGNAVKFTPDEGVIRIGTYFLGLKDGICEIKITVTDTGIGISDEQQARLFNQFEQAESSTTRKYGGTGLGLPISKSIVEMMSGKIWVESELGKGATFALTVQVKQSDIDEKKQLGYGLNWNNVRILVVDNDTDTMAFFKKITGEFGAKCDTVLNGEDALRLIRQNGIYNIYFVGWDLPDINGLDLVKRLKEMNSAGVAPTIAMFSDVNTFDVFESDAKLAGVDLFVAKPLFSSNIIDTTNEILGLKKHIEDAEEEAAVSFEGHHILLAEDVEINREIILALLEPTHLNIECAVDGSKAVKMFKTAPDRYDMIFMDVQMPEMDGYEATRAIRALDVEKAKTIPIIAMTANVFREDVERCLEAGMNGHIGKPINLDDVLDQLRRFIYP